MDMMTWETLTMLTYNLPYIAHLLCLCVLLHHVCRRCVINFREINVQHDWKVWNLRCIWSSLLIYTRNVPNHDQV